MIVRNDKSWLNTCRHCHNAPCINACLTGALQKDDQGIVFIDSQRCVGCFTCVMVCPFGHIQPSRDSYRVVKCDLCRDQKGDSGLCVLLSQRRLEPDRGGGDKVRYVIIGNCIAAAGAVEGIRSYDQKGKSP